MGRLLWSFTVETPVENGTISSNEPKQSTDKPRLGVPRLLGRSKTILPTLPKDVTIFQVYLNNQNDNSSTLKNEASHFEKYSPLTETPTDYGEEIKAIVNNRNYSLELVATTQDLDNDASSSSKNIFSTTFHRQMIPFLLKDGFSADEKQHKIRELDESLMSLLFGLPLSRPPPLWVTVIQKSGMSGKQADATAKNQPAPYNATLILQIRRGYPLRSNTNWTPWNASILGEITFKQVSNNSRTDSEFNMLYQSSNQLMHAQRHVSQLKIQMELLTNQLNEFMALKENSEADLLEKTLAILNKKKEKMEQLKAGVDIPDDDDSALYDFYTSIGEFSKSGLGVDRFDRNVKTKDEISFPKHLVTLIPEIPLLSQEYTLTNLKTESPKQEPTLSGNEHVSGKKWKQETYKSSSLLFLDNEDKPYSSLPVHNIKESKKEADFPHKRNSNPPTFENSNNEIDLDAFDQMKNFVRSKSSTAETDAPEQLDDTLGSNLAEEEAAKLAHIDVVDSDDESTGSEPELLDS